MSYSVDIDENQELFKKPRGERRWLGKEHHRGKERCFDSVKDRTFIEKTVRSQGPLSKKVNAILNASSKDGLELNVVYSMDKKNRWRDSDNVTLLGSVSEYVNAEVIQKNLLNKSTFSVTSRHLSPENESVVFGIRTAKSSGKGQDYTNFLPKSRELSKKANAKMMKVEEEREEKPMVSYNIYKIHRSMQAVGGQMFKDNVIYKSGKHRRNQKVDYDDSEDEYYEEEVGGQMSKAKGVSKSGKQRGNKKFDMEVYDEEDYDDFWGEEENEIFSPVKPQKSKSTSKSSQELQPSVLESEGFTFQEITLFLFKLKDNFIFKKEMELLENEYSEALKIKNLRPNQYLMDVSKWCQPDEASKDGETNTVIVITHLKGMKFHVLVNSTIPCYPAERGGLFLKHQISKCSSIVHLIETITDGLKKNRRITEAMELAASTPKYYWRLTLPNIKPYSKMLGELVETELLHSEWTNSKELSTTGMAIKWEDTCNKVKESENSRKTEGSDRAETCDICNKTRKPHELFLTSGNGIKCTICLREEFYKEFNARRFPINLKINNQHENLPTFLPLTVIFHYVWMVYKEHKDLRISGALGKCPRCNFILHFPKGFSTIQIQNLSCPCGHFWCRHCDRVPHWPMNCEDYEKWEDKCLISHSLLLYGNKCFEPTTLAQFKCRCENVITNSTLPFYWPCCQKCRNPFITDYCCLDHYYEPKAPNYVDQKYKNINPDSCNEWRPYFVIYTKIRNIPGIIKVVCEEARDLRFNVITSNHSQPVQKVLVTAAYLVEMVTAWMFETGREEPEIKKELDGIMKNWNALERRDSEADKKRLEKIREGIDAVVKAVEEKMKL